MHLVRDVGKLPKKPAHTLEAHVGLGGTSLEALDLAFSRHLALLLLAPHLAKTPEENGHGAQCAEGQDREGDGRIRHVSVMSKRNADFSAAREPMGQRTGG